MKSLVEIIEKAMPCPVYANETTDRGECMVYDMYTTTFDAAKRNIRMKVNIYAATMERGVELENILDEALVQRGESPLTETVTGCARNGGGWLKDGDRHVRIAYYDIVLRRKRS
jgi:hypothetical protein